MYTFANEFVRTQLLEADEVVPFRGGRTTGDTWWTDAYGTTKDGEIHVALIKAVSPTVDALARYQPLSGFPSTAAWIDAIEELHGSTTETGYLYQVTEREETEQTTLGVSHD